MTAFAVAGFGAFWRQHNRAWKDYKFSGTPGVPDVMGVVRGRLVCVECKTKRDKASSDQLKFQRMVVGDGGIYVFARSAHDCKPIITAAKTLTLIEWMEWKS